MKFEIQKQKLDACIIMCYCFFKDISMKDDIQIYYYQSFIYFMKFLKKIYLLYSFLKLIKKTKLCEILY